MTFKPLHASECTLLCLPVIKNTLSMCTAIFHAVKKIIKRLAYTTSQLLVLIDACRPGHTQALPRLLQIRRTHITRTRREDTWSSAYSICMHRRMYSVQCRDKIRFLQLHVKCGIAKFSPGIHTALQVPMLVLEFLLQWLILCMLYRMSSKNIFTV